MKYCLLPKIAVELGVQTYILHEYFQEQGFEIVANRILPVEEVSEAAYTKAVADKGYLQTLQEIREKELEWKITFLKDQIKTWELIGWGKEDNDRLRAYSKELQVSESLWEARELGKNMLSWYALESESDSADEVDEDTDERVEFSVYNSTGYVTFTTDLKEARALASQFSGYVVDENGNQI